MGGTDAGARRHGRDIGRHGNKATGASRACSGRVNIDNRGDGRGIKRFDDLFGGIEQAARRIELDNQADVVVLCGKTNGALDIGRGDRADSAGNGYDSRLAFPVQRIRTVVQRAGQASQGRGRVSRRPSETPDIAPGKGKRQHRRNFSWRQSLLAPASGQGGTNHSISQITCHWNNIGIIRMCTIEMEMP